jgi:hypothetical protein
LNVNPKTQARKGLIIYNHLMAWLHWGNMSIQIILIFFKSSKKKSIVLWEKMKDNFPKRDQMFLLITYLVFLLQKNLLRNMMCNKNNFWKI